MPLSTQIVDSGHSLLRFWDTTRLRVSDAGSSSASRESATATWSEALTHILCVGYGVDHTYHHDRGRWSKSEQRTCPSAGALYPFEVIVTIAQGHDDSHNYLYRLEQGALSICSNAALSPVELADLGLVTAPGTVPEAVIFLIARPWLTMEKYRLRGYAYCHLDVGHAATNLALYASALGYAPTVHLRFSRAEAALRLGLDGLCREPLLALSFAVEGESAPPHRSGVALGSGPTHNSASLEPPDSRELENWELLREILSSSRNLPVATEPTATSPLLASGAEGPALRLPDPPSPQTTPAAWRETILGRRSAKGFRSEPLEIAGLSQVLAAIAAPSLRTDSSTASPTGLRARLVAKNVEGVSGVYDYDAPTHSLHRLAIGDPLDFRPSCMGQALANNAAALIFLHAPFRHLIEEQGYSAFAELHFYAAQLAQQAYLAAYRAGVGMTCIGGFDETQCARLGRLDDNDEVIYVIVLGVADETASKHDRLRIAYSHGHTT